MSLRQLGSLQRQILISLDYLINNHPDTDHDTGYEWYAEISYGALFNTVEPYWQLQPDESYEKQRLAHKAAFSRALHKLYDDGFIVAWTLAWVIVSKETGNQSEEILWWQGGGRQRDRFGVPRFRLLNLTTQGRFAIKEIEKGSL